MKKQHGAILLFIGLMAFWVIMSTELSIIGLSIGVAASLLVVFYNIDLLFNEAEMTHMTLKKLWALVRLFYHLLINIAVSNIEVAKIVLSKDMKIHPGFQTIPQPLKKDLNQALFGNAITLTPGTLTVDMDATSILVHGLNVEHVDDIKKSKMQAAFVAFEEEKS